MKKEEKRMVGVRLDPEVRTSLVKLAEDEERSLAAMIRKILREFLRERGLLADRPRKAAK
jgi:hypothetical protein